MASLQEAHPMLLCPILSYELYWVSSLLVGLITFMSIHPIFHVLQLKQADPFNPTSPNILMQLDRELY